MPFSTGTRLEHVGSMGRSVLGSMGRFAGSVRCAPLQRQETKRIDKGSPVAAPMPKLVLSCGKKRTTAYRANVLRTFHRWGGLVYIVDVFPNLMMIRIPSYWMRDFMSLSLSD